MTKPAKILTSVIVAILVLTVGTLVAYKIIENNIINRESIDTTIESVSSTPVETQNQSNQTNEDSMQNTFDITLTINGQPYTTTLETTPITRAFADLLPLELTLDDLNHNEKYVYLDLSLPEDAYQPEHIQAGDLMLYGDNCLVLFYQSFDTSYSYTEIGHLNHLPELGQGSISVKIELN